MTSIGNIAMLWTRVSTFVNALAITCLQAVTSGPPALDRDATEKAVRAVLEKPGGSIKVGLWVGGSTGEPVYSLDPARDMPTASAIKTAILIELFARFADRLDRPAPGLDEILEFDHPAIAHFNPAQQDEIRKGLDVGSVRRLGGIMMGSVPASNLVYNAAANVSIALLGGPAEASRAIHARDPAFAPIAVRRYMLTDRRANGDNEATAASLAAVLQRLAARELAGLEPATVEDIRRAILVKDEPRRGRHYYKEGELTSDPLTCVRSGWFEPKDGGKPVVYVAMLSLENPGTLARDVAYGKLAATAGQLVDALVDAPR